MAREGVPPTRNCPRWLEPSQDGTGYDKIEDRVRVVQDIFAMAASGMGELAIIEKLKAKGDLNFRKPPTPWQAGQIDHIVLSKATRGIMVWRGRDIMHYPPVVDDTTWRAAQQARKANRYTKQDWAGAERTGAPLPQIKNLFPSKFFCAHCRGKMAFNSSAPRKDGSARFRLYCIAAMNKSGCTAAKAGINYTVLEKSILARIEYADREGLLNSNPSEEIRAVDLKIDQIKNALDAAEKEHGFLKKLKNRSAKAIDELNAADDEVVRLQSALREAESNKPARTTHDHTEALAELRAAAEAGDYASRKRVQLAMHSLVDRIDCDVVLGLSTVSVAHKAYSFIVDADGNQYDFLRLIERGGEQAAVIPVTVTLPNGETKTSVFPPMMLTSADGLPPDTTPVQAAGLSRLLQRLMTDKQAQSAAKKYFQEHLVSSEVQEESQDEIDERAMEPLREQARKEWRERVASEAKEKG